MRPTWEAATSDEIKADIRRWMSICGPYLFLSSGDKMMMHLKRQCMTAVYLAIKES